MNQKERSRLSREKIIAASLQEFGTNGFRGTTINAICGHGIAKGLLYHNFSGKEELFLLCAERCFSNLTAYLRAEKGEESLSRALRLREQFFRENPLYARVFFEAILQPPPGLRQDIKEIRKEFDQFNRALYARIISGLELREGVTAETAMAYCELIQDMFNCYFNSPAYAGWDMRDIMEAHESRLETMLDFMLYGIAKE